MDTQVIPDAATCDACQQELFALSNRRFHYPFTNCTHCGPRFTIIRHMPYDRPNTAMADFPLCPNCLEEYQSPQIDDFMRNLMRARCVALKLNCATHQEKRLQIKRTH